MTEQLHKQAKAAEKWLRAEAVDLGLIRGRGKHCEECDAKPNSPHAEECPALNAERAANTIRDLLVSLAAKDQEPRRSLDARTLLVTVDSIRAVDVCECARPKSAHTFWNDRVYDVQGLTCPGGVGGEYRYSPSLTAQRYLDARVAALEAALDAPLVSPSRAEDRHTQEDRERHE